MSSVQYLCWPASSFLHYIFIASCLAIRPACRRSGRLSRSATCLQPSLSGLVPSGQAEAHRDILARFSADMDRLASCELHPGARTGTSRRLLDLLPEQRLRDWAEACRRSHSAFGDKVQSTAGP